MDMTASIVPKSDQLNADDLMTGPITVTIAKVSAGSAEQPVDVGLVEFPGRAFRPSKSMRRVMVAAWGAETSAYTGHRMTLYRDPSIRFGRDEVGGIRISHLSHIDKQLKLALTISRGKRETFTVEPLPNVATESAQTPTRADLKEAGADFGPGVGQLITEKQIAMISSLLKKLCMDDREIATAFITNAIGRTFSSPQELTAHEGSKAITALLAEEEKQKLAAKAREDGE